MPANVPPIIPVQQPDPLASVGKALSVQGMLQQQQARDEELKQQKLATEQSQRQAQSQKAIVDAWQEADGNLMKAIPIAAKNRALPGDLIKLQAAATEQTKANLDLLQKKGERALQEADVAQGIHDQIAQLPEDQRPTAYLAGLDKAKQFGIDTSKFPQQYDPQTFQMAGVTLRGHSAQLKDLADKLGIQKSQGDIAKQQAELPGVQAKADQEVRANAASQLSQAADQADYDTRRGQLPFAIAKQFPDKFDKDAILQSGMTPHEQASLPTDKIELKDWLSKNPGKGPSDYVAWKAKQAPLAQVQILNDTGQGKPAADVAKKFGMTAESFDQTAEKYYSTGTLPPVGRGQGLALNKAVMNRAAELHPGASLALNSAEYKANEGSLKKLTAQTDAVEAFESTAGKNLDQFLTTAKSAIDSGVPLINTPLRMITKQLGGKDQAAYDAARQVAINEIAKVVASPGLSGTLSDSARHEVDAFNPQNATLAQTYKVATILKQDMANRRESYKQQIEDIKGRLAGGQKSEASDFGAAPAGKKDGDTGTLPDGTKVVIKNGRITKQ